jgi:uncharacterized repeat protein (TIGR01451 family)
MSLRVLWLAVLASLLGACGGGGGSGADGGGGQGADSGDHVSLTATASTVPVPSEANTDLDFEIVNPAASAANDVTLTVTLGEGLFRAGVRCTASGGAMCPIDRDVMTVDTLPPGSHLHFIVSVIPPKNASGPIRSMATVTAANDTLTSNNSAEISLTVYSAAVSVVGSSSTSDLSAGSSARYSLTVANAGPDAARDVLLENALSDGQTQTSMTCEASGGAVCPATLGERMTVDSLPSGGSLTFSVTAQLAMSAVVSVNDQLRATVQGDADLKNNSATASVETRIPTSPDTPSFVILKSDVGDYIGDFWLKGASYSYTRANALFEVYALDGALYIKVHSDEDWSGLLYLPGDQTQVREGRYIARRNQPYLDPMSAGLSFLPAGRGCDTGGWYQVDNVVYAAGEIAALDLRFEQHCGGIVPALRGQIHWVAGDETRPPGPVNPPPSGLWAPAAGATPASGNYLYMESDADDFIGAGSTETHTQADSVLTVDYSAGVLGVLARAEYNVGGTFAVMSPLTRLEPGYYADVQVYPSGNPTVGRLNFSRASHSCQEVTGWFVIDSISYSGETVTGVDLRFEQHCEGATPVLHGAVHWRADDPTQPPGPEVPPPADLWTPPLGALPATGNVVYLQSDATDFIGKGLVKVYTPLDSVIDIGGGGVTPVGNRLQLTVQANEEWTGFFQAMNTLPDLRPGYYGNLFGFPNHNPAVGGLSWSGEGRACNDASGWFVIDSVTYSGSTLNSIELRFEQHCEFRSPALRGMIRWSASDTRHPPPPQNPAPSGLWDADAGATPATGNYLYLQSDAGDFVGRGQSYLLTADTADFETRSVGSVLNFAAYGDAHWGGAIGPMVPLSQLQVGYYGNVTERDIAKGILDWGGDGRACARITGWFVVDVVSFEANVLKALDLRFEQHCEGAAPALHGKIHWRFDNPP